MRSRSYYVYALSNERRTVLYVGVTNDLVRRLGEHRSGSGDTFSTRYRATDLVWFEAFPDVNDAIAREKQVKAWRRAWKWDLVRSVNPDLSDRSDELIHLR
ncbi:MAG TPA: GIY-YIG nuclease family protein [Rubricoccaceae bacterium]